MTETKRKMAGIAYCSIWYISIMVGFYYLVAPLWPLLIFHRKLYRKLTDILYVIWESFNVSLLEIVFGVQTFISGESFRPEENCLILLNHRTRVDWNFLWSALLHATSPPAHNAKLVLKDDVKKIPGLGWIMQMSRFIYISRKWDQDEVRIGKMVSYLGKHSAEHPYQIVLFPEGTNLTPDTKAKSKKYGEANNMKPLQHLLHPRTTGFTYLVQQMRENGGLQAIYDVTIAYPDEIPETEKDLLDGKFPNEVHFHIKRHSANSLPTTFIGLEKWLQELWRDKDQLLDKVYTERVRMPVTSSRQNGPQMTLPLQYLSLLAWLAFILKILQILFTTWSPFHWLWIICSSTVMALVSNYTNGLQELEAKLDTLTSPAQLFTACMSLIRPKRD